MDDAFLLFGAVRVGVLQYSSDKLEYAWIVVLLSAKEDLLQGELGNFGFSIIENVGSEKELPKVYGIPFVCSLKVLID